MSWFRKRTKRRRSPGRLADWTARLAGLLTSRGLRILLWPLVAVGAVWGFGRLEAYLLADPAFDAAPNIVLADAPEGIDQSVRDVLAPFAQEPWNTPDLCVRIGRALESCAWVEKLGDVRRYPDGTIVISCDYRNPAALVQVGSACYLIADDGVRLPGSYQYHPSLVLIQGVSASPPQPGDAWPGDDVDAALRIVALVRNEPFYDQITGVLVGNYAGRSSKREPHLLLATAPSGSRIVWGSAPGEEIEENTIEQKMQLLWENYRRWGRIDAGRDYIDISTFPDRFTTRAPA